MAADLPRVRQAIAPAILSWCRARLAAGRPEFHVDDLRRHIAAALPTAPDSAGRILRDLRSRGALSYRVIDRRASLYRLEPHLFDDLDAPPPSSSPPTNIALDDAGQALMWGAR